MAKIENSVPLFGPIAPNDTADSYATHFEDYGQGGFRTVATIEARDGIPTARRKEGMEVKVLADGKTYELIGGLSNERWQEVITGGDVDPAVVAAAVDAALANSDIAVTQISGGTFIGSSSVTDVIRGGTF